MTVDHSRIMQFMQAMATAEQEEDPAVKLIEGQEKAILAINTFAAQAKTQLAAAAGFYVDKLMSIIKFQGEELLIFRALEALIRSQKLEETSLTEILEELKSLRVSAMEAAKAEVGKAVAVPAANT